jgi:hypothetical protein
MALMFSATFAGAAAEQRLTRLANAVWEQTFVDAARELELKGIAPVADGAWMAVGLRPKGALGGPQTVELWRLGSGGEELRRVPAASLGEITPQESVAGFAAIGEGRAGLVLQSAKSVRVLVLDQDAKVARSRELPMSLPFAILRVVPLSDRLAIVGRYGTQGWLLTIGADGEVALDVKLAAPGVTALNDVVEVAGEYVGAGSRLEAASKAAVWFGRFNSQGVVVAETSMPGVHPSLTRDNAGYVVTYQTDAAKGRDVVVEGLGAELKSQWRTIRLRGVRGLRPYHVAPAGGDEYLLIGEGEAREPIIERFRRAGANVWTYTMQGPPFELAHLSGSHMTRAGSHVIVGFTALAVSKSGETLEQRQVVRLVRFPGA